MAATILIDEIDSYVSSYGPHAAIQRLQFIMGNAQGTKLKIDAGRLCLDYMKRTTSVRGYTEMHNQLQELMSSDAVGGLPPFDQVWVEATQKQAAILKDLYEQDLQQAKASQIKESIRSCHTQLANLFAEQCDYAAALKHVSKSREFCTDPQAIFATCMSLIRLAALMRQYNDIQSFACKAYHTPFKDETGQSKIFAAHGLYYMSLGKYKDAAINFTQVKQQELVSSFCDVLGPQDVALYGALCALASLDRNEVQAKLLDNATFRECLNLVPQIRDITIDFCSCNYGACLGALERLKEPLSLDVHLHGQLQELCQQIRSKGMVQYFAPFLSVSLRSMAEAFNTNVDGIQREVAQMISKGQLNAKIDSHKKILHVRHADQRRQTYRNTMRVSQDFLDATQALLLRMSLLKHDFGVHLTRQKK